MHEFDPSDVNKQVNSTGANTDTPIAPVLPPAPAVTDVAQGEPATAPTLFERQKFSAGRWVLFSLIFALLPILLIIMSLLLHDLPITVENTIGHGELLLICGAILCELTGDVVFNEDLSSKFKTYTVGWNLLFLLLAFYMYSDIYRSIALSEIPGVTNVPAIIQALNINHLWFIGYSFALLFYTILTGINCKIRMVEEKKKKEKKDE